MNVINLSHLKIAKICHFCRICKVKALRSLFGAYRTDGWERSYQKTVKGKYDGARMSHQDKTVSVIS